MKLITLLSILIISTLSFAEEGKNFEKRKSEKLARIDKRIAIFSTYKSCVSSATNKDDLKKCHETKKSSMKSLTAENKDAKAKRKQMREKRKAKRKENK